MTATLIWATLILCAGLMLLIAEVFIPSGGVLGILSALALLGSIVLAFTSSAQAGMTFLVIVGVALPTILLVGLELWPKTPFGRRMSLARPSEAEIDPRDDRARELVNLIGHVGRTITPLRPSGMTDFDGQRVDTIAEGMMIDADTLVRVMDVQGRRVLVRKVELEPPHA